MVSFKVGDVITDTETTALLPPETSWRWVSDEKHMTTHPLSHVHSGWTVGDHDLTKLGGGQGIRIISLPSDHSSSPYVRDWNGGKIDIYRICQLWGASHPAQLHALKKILCAGQRGGGKDIDRDIREAIVALERWLEMRKEDAK